jgi:Pyruvate/2-oxoacid:ferredoxin oxidoreductase delta subunit
MSEQVYKDMIDVMNKRGGLIGGEDIPEFYTVAKALFTPEEAEINNAMPQGMFTAADLAKETGGDEAEIAVTLKSMANKGLCVSFVKDGTRLFRPAPFVPGIFEFVFYRGTTTDRDRELAKAIHAYEEAWRSKSAMKLPYPIQRVITVNERVDTGNKVHTYDQVKTYIEENDTIAVGRCFCRHAALLRDEDTHGMPMDACMWLGSNAEFGIDCLGARKVTKEEAMKLLDEYEEAGLVHQTSNFADGISYICNCDRWHCGSIRANLSGLKVLNSSGFEPHFDEDLCAACETCIERCPARALTMGEDDVPKVDLDTCFGCAVCATGCQEEAVKMVSKPGFEEPPQDRKAMQETLFAAFAKQG